MWNIGKTKVVELDNAIEDYLIYPHPGTAGRLPGRERLLPEHPGLRTLQAIESLRPLLAAVREEADRVCPNRHVPLTVKIAPTWLMRTLSRWQPLREGTEAGRYHRHQHHHRPRRPGPDQRHDQGQGNRFWRPSGAPLKPRSLEVLRLLKREIGDDLAIISVGGVTTAEDAGAPGRWR